MLPDHEKSRYQDVYARLGGRTFCGDTRLIPCAGRNKAKEILEKLDQLSVCGGKRKILEGFECYPAGVHGRSNHRLLG
ncbi:hypothetical protein DSTSK_20950 [Desulforhabdus sp. TSK]|nr:hypothetical protein DSTSK_20950 [Desulforhabdus sp. TSK]